MNQTRDQGTDLGLLNRVRNPGDNESWQVFFDIYQPFIYHYAIRAGLSHDDASEVAQQTLIEVSKQMPDFAYRRKTGSFRGWLRKLIRWRIADFFKLRRQEFVPLDSVLDGEDDSGDEARAKTPSLSSETDRSAETEWKQFIFEIALDKVRQKLRVTPRQVLDRVVVNQEGVAQVAESLHLEPKQASVIKSRVVATLRNEVQRLQRQEFPEANPAADSRRSPGR